MSKEFDQTDAQRKRDSHDLAVKQAKYKGKAIIAPSSEINLTIITSMIGGIFAISIAHLLLQNVQAFWAPYAYMAAGLAGSAVGFFILSSFFVIDESLDKEPFDNYTGFSKNK